MSEAADKFRQTVFIVLVGFIFALYFAALMHFLRFQYPWTTFLFWPADRFMDFFNTYAVADGLNPYFGRFKDLANYFPATYLFMWPLTWLDSWTAFFIFNIIFVYALFKICYYYLKSIRPFFSEYEYTQSLIILVFLSYPVIFCLDRGNIDNLLFVIIAMFFICFQQQRYKSATVLLALATAMKLYPLVLITLFIKEKKWWHIVACGIAVGLFTLVALASFQGGIRENAQQCLLLIARFKDAVIHSDSYLYFCTSLFTLLKVILKNYSAWVADPEAVYQNTLQIIFACYSVITLSAFALISLYIYFVENIFWKQAMLLISAMVIFPIVSGDYKMIYFFIPFLLFVAAKDRQPHDKLYTILFAILFIPKNYFLMPHTPQFISIVTTKGPQLIPGIAGVSVNNVLNILIVLFFMCHMMFAGMRKFNYLRNGKLIYE